MDGEKNIYINFHFRDFNSQDFLRLTSGQKNI